MRNATVQKVKPTYEKTKNVRKMLTHKLLNEAIRNNWEAIKKFLPARTATNLRYDKGSKKAVGWDEGGKEERIDLPLQDGWYLSDGNPFDIPNGKPSDKSDPNALYLVRYQDKSFNGPLGRGGDVFGYVGRWRGVYAFGFWSVGSGVAFVERKDAVPLISVPEEKLVKIADPKTLRQDAEQLRELAENLSKRFEGDTQTQEHVIKPMLEKAARFVEVAEAIEAGMK